MYRMEPQGIAHSHFLLWLVHSIEARAAAEAAEAATEAADEAELEGLEEEKCLPPL